MKSRLQRFTYTKDSGEKSSRTVIMVSEPSDLKLCYDISNDEELDIEDINFISKKLENIEEQRLRDIRQLTEQYSLQIKTFKKSGISDLQVGK